MTGLIAGVLPVFLMIALGYGLRKSGFLPDEAWRPIEKLSINLLYPGFLIPAIWHADLSGDSAGPAGGAAVISVIIVAVLALARPRNDEACVAQLVTFLVSDLLVQFTVTAWCGVELGIRFQQHLHWSYFPVITGHVIEVVRERAFAVEDGFA